MTSKEEEYDKQVVEKAKGNHIWVNAMNCVSPTDKFKIGLADDILEMLNEKERLMDASYAANDDKNLKELAKLTPMLYLSINKS